MTDGTVRVRRVYDDAGADEGVRVLVDRVWPRGLRAADVGHDVWLKDVAPSRELRTWYGHDPAKFEEFRDRYHEELASEPARGHLDDLRDRLADAGTLTLLTSTRDVEHSHAAVLAELLRESR